MGGMGRRSTRRSCDRRRPPPGERRTCRRRARAVALASNLRCPFCQGESIAEAPSQVARDLEAFIVEKVGEGWTDQEIYAFFEARYGERVRLDPPLAGWGAALWLSPLALLGVGVAAIVSRRRARPVPTSVASGVVPKVEAS